MRQRFAAAIIIGSLASTALAQDLPERVASKLAEQGFSRIEVSRTWLGRTRIVAEGDGVRREIVLHPTTGALLFDEITGDQACDGRFGGVSGCHDSDRDDVFDEEDGEDHDDDDEEDHEEDDDEGEDNEDEDNEDAEDEDAEDEDDEDEDAE